MSELEAGSPVARMRAEFDRAFAEPLPPRAEGLERLLAVGLGDGDYALRLSELAGLSAGKALTEGPGRAPGYLGLTGLRGVLVPVWDLAQLLGHPGQASQPRWLALAAAQPRWAAAFDRFEGTYSASAAQFLPHQGGGAAAALTPQACDAGGRLRLVIDLASVLQTIQGRIRA